jgi:T-complex protein 1 subunit theta
MEINHPAANMLIMQAKMQNTEYGDNTNYCVSFAGELLKKAEKLIKMGIHTADIVIGFRRGVELLESYINKFKSRDIKDVKDLKEVKKFMFACISSKQLGLEDIICELVADACIRVCPKDPANFSVENVRVSKLQGSNIYDSEVIKGMVVNRKPEGSIVEMVNGKVVVYMCPFDSPQAEAKATVVMNDDNELMNFAKGEEEEMENFVKELKNKGIKCVIINGP